MAISHTRSRIGRRSLPNVGGILAALGMIVPQTGTFLEASAAPPLRLSSFHRVRAVPQVLHFTAADVVRYFSGVLEVRPKRAKDGSIVFEDNRSRWPEERYRILIAQEAGDVVVSFEVGGDFGMNLAREFFECGLFQRAESEQLYGLLSEANKAPTVALQRFSVSLRSWETKDKIHVVLRFFRPGGMVASRQ